MGIGKRWKRLVSGREPPRQPASRGGRGTQATTRAATQAGNPSACRAAFTAGLAPMRAW